MQEKRRWLPRWQRVELVQMCLVQGMSRRQAAAWRRVSVATVQYWIDRYRCACDQDHATGAWAEDRPSTPHHQPARSSELVHDRVCEERRRTGWGPRLIASELQMPHATVSRCLARRGLSRAPKGPREAVRRFEWPCPGDLLQMDVKRFARFSRPGHRVTGDRYRSAKEKRARVGWEYAHSMIDDHSRLLYTELHPDERAATVTGFVGRALAFYARHGIRAKRLQTDNHFSYAKNLSLRELLARARRTSQTKARGARRPAKPARESALNRHPGPKSPRDAPALRIREDRTGRAPHRLGLTLTSDDLLHNPGSYGGTSVKGQR